MIKIEVPYSFTSEEIEIINTNPPKNGEDWRKDIFKAIKQRIKEHLLIQQERICPYCGLELMRSQSFHPIEHFAHKQKHYRFMFEPKNLLICCTQCNTHKSTKETLRDPNVVVYPANEDDFIIIQPHFDDYFQHIEVVHDIFLKAKTEKGNRTILYCRLFRSGLAEDRMVQRIINREETYKKMILQLARENDPNIKQQIIGFLKDHTG